MWENTETEPSRRRTNKTYDPKNPHYDPYTAPPVFDGQPVTGAGYPDGGYPDSSQQQTGYPGQYAYAPPMQPQAPAYGPGGYSTPQMPMYRSPENGMGIAALILGILGLITCMACGIAAIICGHMGVKKADRGEADNRGMAQAGLVMGYISVGLWLLIIVAYVLFFVILIGTTSSTTPSDYSSYSY